MFACSATLDTSEPKSDTGTTPGLDTGTTPGLDTGITPGLDTGIERDARIDLDDGIPADIGRPDSLIPVPDAEPPCAQNRNDEIRLRLMPQCGACHRENTNQPFFTSLRAFEELVVYNPNYVNQADPEDSELLRLLEGRGRGTYPQMPVGGEPFAVLAERGETDITMAEIREWLNTLPPPVVNAEPDPLSNYHPTA